RCSRASRHSGPEMTSRSGGARAWRALTALLVFGCHRAPRDGAPPPGPSQRPVTSSASPATPVAPAVPKSLRELTWHYDDPPFGASEVVVAIPSGGAEGERFPVLVGFHGRGESLKGPKRG